MRGSFFIGGSILVACVATAVACGQSGSNASSTGSEMSSGPSTTATTGSNTTTSTTSTGSNTTTTTGTSTESTTSSGMGGATTTSTTGSSMGGSGTGGSSCKAPGTLHPPDLDAGNDNLYCPFSGVDGGKNQYCTGGTQHCCETKAGGLPSSCQDLATPCGATDTDWQCEDPIADCSSGQVCCSNVGASIGLGGMMNGMACQNFANMMHGTICQAGPTCPSGSIQMCTSDGECPSGMTCTPFSKAGNQVGGCM